MCRHCATTSAAACSPNRSGGHREYGPEAVTVLRVIRGLARLGFTLDEISELIEVGSHRGPRPGLRDAAAKKLAEVEAKIADMHQVRATLTNVLSAGCSDLAECSCTPGCPIPFADLDWDAARRPTTHGHEGA
jgi:MerR family transcriptional regulator, mercuric resistance operon regulatory protein